MANYIYLVLNILARLDEEIVSDDQVIEVIIKYNGNIFGVATEVDAEAEILSSSYAIFTMPVGSIEKLYDYDEVEYFELPKNVTFVLQQNLDACSIASVQDAPPFFLTGIGILVGIIDSGIDYTHPDFRNADGSTRIFTIWDQTIDGNPPPGFLHGSVYSKEDIDEALLSDDPLSIVPSTDDEGHGTAVSGIAAGNGSSSDGKEKGAAPESNLAIVKLGTNPNNPFTRDTQIMRGLKFLYDFAEEMQMPISINISYGTSDGSHNGDTLFERFIDSIASRWISVISIANGNEGSAGHHYRGQVEQGQSDKAQISVAGISQFNMTLWKNFADTILFELISPSGKSSGTISSERNVIRVVIDNVEVSVIYSQPNHYNGTEEVYFLFRGVDGTPIQGLWTLNYTGLDIVDGNFNIWLPTVEQIGRETSFLRPCAENSITLPATSRNPISVGGYDSSIYTGADFSGRGLPYDTFWQKPDLVAPAVNILTTKAGGGYDTYSGTSMAAPFVTGSAALMMEWGHTEGNDPFLYGQRVKAFLCCMAKRDLPIDYPNSVWGYGVLDL